MAGLSEKAKGKQRAVEPPEEPNPLEQMRPLTIRFTNGLPDFSIILDARSKDTVRKVKGKLQALQPTLAKRRLRFIYSGRLLADNVVLHAWLTVQDAQHGATSRQADIENASNPRIQGKQRSSAADDENEAKPGFGANATPKAPTWLHCSVGEELAEGEKEDDEKRRQDSEIKPVRGLDRLAMAGFSEADIAQIRRTFRSQSSVNYLDLEPLGEDEDYEEHAMILEEQWIESMDSGADSTLSLAAASMTILQGLIAGFFFPLLPFFFIRDSYPAVFWEDGSTQERTSSVIFSKRMQMALVIGFLTNITFGTWRYVLGG